MRFLTPVHRKETYDLPSLIDDVFSGFLNDRDLFSRSSEIAKIDLAETDKEVNVKLEVPGLDKKDINVEYKDGYLNINGEKKEIKQNDHHYREIYYGKFSRVVKVGNIDFEKSSAKYNQGVLEISLPKVEEETPHRLLIK